jgi:hypothetical protein
MILASANASAAPGMAARWVDADGSRKNCSGLCCNFGLGLIGDDDLTLAEGDAGESNSEKIEVECRAKAQIT